MELLPDMFHVISPPALWLAGCSHLQRPLKISFKRFPRRKDSRRRTSANPLAGKGISANKQHGRRGLGGNTEIDCRAVFKMAAPAAESDTCECKSDMAAVKAASSVFPLALRIVAECPVSKARACVLTLPHGIVYTPVFMPVGTQGTMKGITAEQLEQLDCHICLGNTYHLGMRPVREWNPSADSDCTVT